MCEEKNILKYYMYKFGSLWTVGLSFCYLLATPCGGYSASIMAVLGKHVSLCVS